MKHKCEKCGRFIKIQLRISTDKEIKENNAPKEYYEAICRKCGKLQIWEVETIVCKKKK
jgi:hypothetical protein